MGSSTDKDLSTDNTGGQQAVPQNVFVPSKGGCSLLLPKIAGMLLHVILMINILLQIVR
jgi:hypothetical protein